MSEPLKNSIDKISADDKFGSWLGIEVVQVEKGHCILKMKVRAEMVNSFGIAHGGICFSLADSAIAYAANMHGKRSVALECSITFPLSVQIWDELTVEAKELSLTNRTATYLAEVKNQKNQNVALIKGTVYRTSKSIT